MKVQKNLLVSFSLIAFLLVGCQGPRPSPTVTQNTSGDVAKILRTTYNKSTGTVTMDVRKVRNAAGEDIVDINEQNGIINFATTRYPTDLVRTVRVNSPTGSFKVQVPPEILQKNRPDALIGGSLAQAMVVTNSISLPPPGTRLDRTIRPVAPLRSSISQKENAVMKIARSKLGTPYIWGHNEDRGQYGFDCSNFTAYVYHHALGYRISTASQVQYHSVGVPIARSKIRVGDLVIFDHGGHVGIYSGNNRVIQDGGGLKKVGYIRIDKRSYWGKRITVVKRMF